MSNYKLLENHFLFQL